MTRPLLLILTALSLLLCAATAAMWVRSYSSAESFTLFSSGHSFEALCVKGSLYLHTEAVASLDPYSWHHESRVIKGREIIMWMDKAGWRAGGFSAGVVNASRYIGMP